MTLKTYNKWKDLIQTKLKYENAPWSENELIHFRSRLRDSDLGYDLLMEFIKNNPGGGYNITVNHQNKGIEYLRKNTYKLNGKLRKNNIFGEFERSVIDDYSHFKLVDMYNDGNGFVQYYLPVYRCFDTKGNYFDYTGTQYSMIMVLDHGKVAA